MPKTKAFKPPKALGACADMLYELRQRRLDLQKDVTAIKEKETALNNHIIEQLPKSDATGVAGKTARVRVLTKAVPVVEDWDKFYAYVSRQKAWELMQRRINTRAIQERLEAGKKVSGTGEFTAVSVSVTKVNS